MIYLVVCGAAFFVSGLTLYSGFGLGTLLMPVFAIFFPVHVAVAATAVVHGANNIFKVLVVGRHADRELVLRFGIPAIVAAFAGAAALGYVSGFDPLATYSIGAKTAVITPLKLVMGILVLIFAMFELLPLLRNLRIDRRHLVWGGLLSGFFGGLSGHQGALRSAFLLKTGVSTNAFIGFMVDMARIVAYGFLFLAAGAASPIGPDQWPLIAAGTGAAFIGVIIGKRWLHKVTMSAVQVVAGILLLGIAVCLMAGIV